MTKSETITLTSGEVLVVERWSDSADNRLLALWFFDKGVMTERILTITKGWTCRGSRTRYWEKSFAYGSVFHYALSELTRYIEILQHAARLAAELDEQFVPGTEVTG